MAIGTAAMYYSARATCSTGTLTLGTLIAISTYLLMLYQPLEALTQIAWALEGAAAGAQRCFEVLDQSGRRERFAEREDARFRARRDRF